MLSTSVPIRREASQGETTTGAADIQGEVVPPQMGPPEHLHARSDAGFLVVKRRHTGKDDRGLALVDDRSTAWHRELAHLKSVFCTQAKNISPHFTRLSVGLWRRMAQGALSLSGSTRLPPVSPGGECPSSTGSTLAGKDGRKHGRVHLMGAPASIEHESRS